MMLQLNVLNVVSRTYIFHMLSGCRCPHYTNPASYSQGQFLPDVVCGTSLSDWIPTKRNAKRCL